MSCPRSLRFWVYFPPQYQTHPIYNPAALKRLWNSTCNSLLAVTELGLQSHSWKGKALSRAMGLAASNSGLSPVHTKFTHSKGDLAQEEAVTSWQVPPRAAAVPAGGWCPITGVKKGTPVPSHPALLLPQIPLLLLQGQHSWALPELTSLPAPCPGKLALPGCGDRGEGHTRSTLTPHRGGRPQIQTGYCRLDGTQPSVVVSRSSKKGLKSRDVMCGTTRTVPSVLFTFLATISEGLESLQFLSHSLFFFYINIQFQFEQTNI